jgi:predicted dehydrogenase
MSAPGAERVRVAVVGAGLISQAMHLPHLVRLSERFELVALVDPSATVRERVGARYGAPLCCESHLEAFELARPDAVIVASPNGTHAEITLAALVAGIHVFVEKPLCITLADADAIIAARERAGRVVQVGYNNRFDPVFERLLEELPRSSERLRYVNVLVHDPEFDPYFGPDDLIRGADVSARLVAASAADEARQVAAAVGAADADTITAFSGGFLGSLVHQVNLVHGMLERMGEPLPATVIGGDSWAAGEALTGSVRLRNGARWDSAWIQLLALHEYEETISLCFEDAVVKLAIPSPWLRQSPSVYSVSRAGAGGREGHRFESYEEAYQRELVHFHDCITAGAACRTPPEQARLDIDVLTQMFRARPRG